MGRHTQSRKFKFAHLALLTLSILSVGSPIGLLMAAAPNRTDEPTIDSVNDDWLALPQGPPVLELDMPIHFARQSTKDSSRVSKHKKESETKKKPAVLTTTTSTKKVTTTRPTTTTTTRPTTRPTTQAQKKIVTSEKAPSTTRAVPSSTRTTTTTTQRPSTTTRTSTTTTSNSSSRTQAPTLSSTSRIVEVAKTYVGDNLPYRMGGDSLTTGIDCSHFVWRVLKESGLNVPYRDSSDLAAWTTRTKTPQPGDLVLYSGHVGIYAGNGMMVHHGKPGGAFFIKVYTQGLIGYGRIPV